MTDLLPCWIYRSCRREGLYVYLASPEGLSDLPPAVSHQLGRTEFAMELELSRGRNLAREDVNVVMDNLREHGFHIQLPPPEREPDPGRNP